ncbi:cobalamin biosynthesis protein CbiX [Cryobacterium melibiosiphilum]|uniref:Cobalamin biosynthesis protein CbiX n=2 Tax=Cryobacterium melibiosiphilum TaxID=995039 RepID=A0A3A5MK91_9MICO|nr:cobalamin biosynthesis protein CbiX [Cryobacterium melibiosiphilum]
MPRNVRSAAQPALVAVSHGTNSLAGQAAIAALVAAVSIARPDLTVAGGFVDVQQPDVATTLGALPDASAAIVVPLLLSAGYHVHVDLQKETAAVDRDTVVSAALGPDRRLVEVLVYRLGQAGYRAGDELVLAAAGSSDARAVEDCREVGRMLAARLGVRVTVGFLSAASPRLACAVAAARIRHPHARLAISTYLMAPGFFFDLTRNVGADLVSDPLLVAAEAPPAGMVDLVIDRYLDAHLAAGRLAAHAA